MTMQMIEGQMIIIYSYHYYEEFYQMYFIKFVHMIFIIMFYSLEQEMVTLLSLRVDVFRV